MDNDNKIQEWWRVVHYNSAGEMIDGSGAVYSLDKAIKYAELLVETKGVGFSNQVEVFEVGHTLEIHKTSVVKIYK